MVVLLLKKTEGKEEPPFLTYDAETRSLVFKPEDEHSGNTYYFTVGLSNPDTDAIYFKQECTVKVAGTADGEEVADQQEEEEIGDRYTPGLQISYAIESLMSGNASLDVQVKFSRAVDMEHLRADDRFADAFSVYWYPTSGV